MESASAADWSETSHRLPRLQQRAEQVIILILGGITMSNDEPMLPANIAEWFKQIYSEREENGYEDAVLLLKGNDTNVTYC
jgi:hypothetical protein